jgi:hypothetical protein
MARRPVLQRDPWDIVGRHIPYAKASVEGRGRYTHWGNRTPDNEGMCSSINTTILLTTIYSCTPKTLVLSGIMLLVIDDTR